MPAPLHRALASIALTIGLVALAVLLAPAAQPSAGLVRALAEDSGPIPLSMAGCEYVEIAVKVDPALTRPLVPAPFQIRIHPTDGTSLVLVGGSVCAEAVSGESVGTGTFGWTSVALAPPADPTLAGEGVGFFLYRLEHFVTDDDVYRDVAEAAMAERTVASIAPELGPLASTLSIQWEGRTHEILDVATVPVPAETLAPIHWREYHVVEGGISYLDATLVGGLGGSNAPGTVRPAAGTLAHAVLGDANAGLGTYGPAFEIRDGSMGFIATG